MAIEKLINYLQGSKIKPGPTHRLTATKKAMISNWSQQRHDREIQNTCI